MVSILHLYSKDFVAWQYFCPQLWRAKEDVTQNSMIVHEINKGNIAMMHDFIADFMKEGDFLKSYWAKWSLKHVRFSQLPTVKGAESIFK